MERMMSPDLCVKCGNKLTDEEKKIGLPLCQKCISSLTDTVMRKLKKSDEKKIAQEIDNFSKFILSSSKLFKLDDIAIIQCCFNIFMIGTRELGDKNLVISKKILIEAINFIERELENINDKINDDEPTSPVGNDLVSVIDKLIQKGMQSDGDTKNSTIEEIERCIDEGTSKGNNGNKKDREKDEDKDKKDNKKEDKKDGEKDEDKKGLEENKDNKSPGKRIDID